MKNYVQEGNNLTLIAPTGGVESGKLIVIEKVAVIPAYSAAKDEEFEGSVTGVYELPKKTGAAITQLKEAYVDANGLLGTASAGTFVGYFTKPAAAADTVCHVSIGRAIGG